MGLSSRSRNTIAIDVAVFVASSSCSFVHFLNRIVSLKFILLCKKCTLVSVPECWKGIQGRLKNGCLRACGFESHLGYKSASRKGVWVQIPPGPFFLSFGGPLMKISFETYLLLIELEDMEVYDLHAQGNLRFPALIWSQGKFHEITESK